MLLSTRSCIGHGCTSVAVGELRLWTLGGLAFLCICELFEGLLLPHGYLYSGLQNLSCTPCHR